MRHLCFTLFNPIFQLLTLLTNNTFFLQLEDASTMLTLLNHPTIFLYYSFAINQLPIPEHAVLIRVLLFFSTFMGLSIHSFLNLTNPKPFILVISAVLCEIINSPSILPISTVRADKIGTFADLLDFFSIVPIDSHLPILFNLNFNVAYDVELLRIDGRRFAMSVGEFTLDGGQIGCVFNSQESAEGGERMREDEFGFGDEEQSTGIVLHAQNMITVVQKLAQQFQNKTSAHPNEEIRLIEPFTCLGWLNYQSCAKYRVLRQVADASSLLMILLW